MGQKFNWKDQDFNVIQIASIHYYAKTRGKSCLSMREMTKCTRQFSVCKKKGQGGIGSLKCTYLDLLKDDTYIIYILIG